MADTCRECRRPLTLDEIGATKKLINRGATAFLCVDCLARHFDVEPSDVLSKIEEYRAMGCTLFSLTAKARA